MFEPYDSSVFALKDGASSDIASWLTQRGFARLIEG